MIDRYKLLLVIPIAVLIFSVTVLALNYVNTGEWILRSIDFKGGTQIELKTGSIDISFLESKLKEKFSVDVREIKTLTGSTILIKTEVKPELILNEINNIGINITEHSEREIGPGVAANFWSQTQIGIIVALILMGILVFILFRTFVPSIAVILAAVSDIIVTLGIMQIIGLELSLPGFAALLMLFGYSVDTDILLTTRLLRGTGELVKRLKSAFKTGLTMSLTTIGALVALILTGVSPVLSEIATVLLIGLLIDLCMTWLQNAAILRWYCERRGI